MGPAQAIATGFAWSLQFSGRATRSEFWWFAPVGIGLPVGTAWFAPPDVSDLNTFMAKCLMFALAAIPLSAACARRYHDSGEPFDEFWRGIGPTLALFVSAGFLALGLFGMASVVYLGLGFLISIPAFILFVLCLFLAPGTLGATMGQLLLPSQPGTNRYGPNPSEAQS